MSFIRSLRAPLRTLPTLSAIPKPAARPAFAFRAFSSTPLARAGGPAPPQLYGEGGKAGEIPTEYVGLRCVWDAHESASMLGMRVRKKGNEGGNDGKREHVADPK